MQTAYQSTEGSVLNTTALSKQANLASNPNIALPNTSGYSRSPLAAAQSKAGMLNRAMDYMKRLWNPRNEDEPLTKNEEGTVNQFSAENKRPSERSEWRNFESVFVEIYKRAEDLITGVKGKDRKYDNNSSPYGSYLDTYSQKYDSRKSKTKVGNGTINSSEASEYKLINITKKVEETAKTYFQKAYNAFRGRKNTNENPESIYEGVAAKVAYAIQAVKGYLNPRTSQGAKTLYFRAGSGDHSERVAYNTQTKTPNYALPVGHGVENYGPKKVVSLVAERERRNENLESRLEKKKTVLNNTSSVDDFALAA
jgi:hypothetical protein